MYSFCHIVAGLIRFIPTLILNFRVGHASRKFIVLNHSTTPTRSLTCSNAKRSPHGFSVMGTSTCLKNRRRPTLPRVCSTIGADGLNFSVRNGKRWNPDAVTTGMSDILLLQMLAVLCFFSSFVLRFRLRSLQPSTGAPSRRGACTSFGQLVRLGFDIAVFTPASYLRHRL